MLLDLIEHLFARRVLVLVFVSGLFSFQAARGQSVAPPDPAPLAVASNAPVANPFESEVTALEGRLSQSPIASSPVVFYGSSSIRLWKSLQQDFSGYAVLNCGFGGSRLTDCVRYANRLVIPRKPSAIVIYAGDNDLAGGAPPEKVFQAGYQILRKEIGEFLSQECPRSKAIRSQ
jgi:hypothetical protein